MEELYKDILNALNKIPTIEIRKKQENEKISLLEPYIKKIINPKTDKKERQEIIEKLKNEIEEISKTSRLRIEKIIKDGKIDNKELNIALEIIYDTTKSKHVFEQIGKYRESNYKLSLTINNIKEKENIKNQIKKLIQEIKNTQEKPYSKNLIKNIIEKQKRKKKINNIKQELIHLIKKIIKDKNELEELEKIINQKKLNTNKLNEIIEEKIENIIKQLEHDKKRFTKENTENYSSIRIEKETLDRIINLDKNDYLSFIAQNNFRKNKMKKNEFISRIILIIKFIELVESDNVEALNELAQLIEQRNELNQITNDTKEHQRKR